MKIGDIVARKKYNKDIIFEIYDIVGEIVYLKGIEIRLLADSTLDDLEVVNDYEIRVPIDENELVRNDEILKGRVLHLDGDARYLKMCLEKYDDLGVIATGYHIKEKEMPNTIVDLLIKHSPDVVVITGHDASLNRGDLGNIDSYTNTRYFIETVKKARVYQPNKDSLVIFAGACQSHYEALIANGANFASSPKRKNIHALDPVYLACQVAGEHVSNYLDIRKILSNTTSKFDGIGGLDTKGVARNVYPR